VSLWSDPTGVLGVQIRDLSRGGIGLFHSERLALDEQIVIRFPLSSGKTVTVLGTVIYWEPLAEKLHGIGVQFDRVIEQSEISEQTDQNTQDQLMQIGVVARLTQAFARTWRVAS
jgi:hypothetical protein